MSKNFQDGRQHSDGQDLLRMSFNLAHIGKEKEKFLLKLGGSYGFVHMMLFAISWETVPPVSQKIPLIFHLR